MKKISKSVALIVAGVSALALAACVPEKLLDDAEAVDFNDFVSERVGTAEAWNQAFDFDDIANATYTVSMESSGDYQISISDHVEGSASSARVYEFDGERIRNTIYYHEIKGTEESEHYSEEIFDTSGDITIYQYDKENEKWLSASGNSNTLIYYRVNSLNASMRSSGIFDTSIIDGGIDVRECGLEYAIRDQFSLFSYDSEVGGYVYTRTYEYDDDYLKFTVKIKNGKFFGLNVDFQYADQSGILCSRLINIGTTVVTLPQIID